MIPLSTPYHLTLQVFHSQTQLDKHLTTHVPQDERAEGRKNVVGQQPNMKEVFEAKYGIFEPEKDKLPIQNFNNDDKAGMKFKEEIIFNESTKANSQDTDSEENHGDHYIKNEEQMESEDDMKVEEVKEEPPSENDDQSCEKESKCIVDIITRAQIKRHNPKQLKCPHCNMVVKGKLERHIQAIHKELNTFSCEYCDFKTSRKDNFRIHIKTKHGSLIFECLACASTFHLRSDLKDHSRKAHDLEQDTNISPKILDHNVKPHKCEVCGKNFTLKGEMNRHIKTVHMKVKTIKCSFCPKTFAKKVVRDSHELLHTGARPFQCDQCVKAFKCKGDLTNHVKYHHNPELENKTFYCDECGKYYDNIGSLNSHKLTIHTIEPNSLSCNKCPCVFNSRSGLKYHMLSHNTDNNFKCALCEAAFNMELKLKRHMERHSGMRKHKCNQCEKSFSDRRSLDNHLKIVHQGKSPNVLCQICQKVFTRETSLVAHIKFVHEGQRPVKCDTCDMAFKDTRDKDKHKLKCAGILM